MKINFNITEAVRKRYSVRNYSDIEISEETMESIREFISNLSNPFGPKVTFHYLDINCNQESQKLGTYGVIKGAKKYIGTTIKDEPFALEALGYEMEALMLYLASLGLGTCWLGGTFDRESFATAMKVDKGELFPAITPYGYPADKKHMKEMAMRTLIKADQRVAWDKIFFEDSFNSPLTQENAGDYFFPLEMLRLGPSASNKQPWRILLREGVFHFYEAKEPGYSDRFTYDIQKIDIGIAAAHFDLAAKEKGIKGEFAVEDPKVELPRNVLYSFSWRIKK
jgi:nitroreductase